MDKTGATKGTGLEIARRLLGAGYAVKVNAADPGYTTADLAGHTGYRSVEQAAEIPVRLATLDAEGPTAGFSDENGALPW